MVGERANPRPSGVSGLNREPTIGAVRYSFSSIKTLGLAVCQEIEHAPYLVSPGGDHVRDTTLAGSDGKIEAKLEIVEHRDSGLEGLHTTAAEERVRVEIAPIREVPERGFRRVVHRSSLPQGFRYSRANGSEVPSAQRLGLRASGWHRLPFSLLPGMRAGCNAVKSRIWIAWLVGAALLVASMSCRTPPAQSSAAGVDLVLIEKAARRLTLLSGGTLVRTYAVALGSQPVGPKIQQGDDRTPEGSYVIDGRNYQSAYHLALHISYPNAVDRDRAATLGVNPGGDIMIHGLPNGFGWVGSAHRERDWTRGCIAVTDSEIEEIAGLVPDGTPVEIRP